MKIVNWILGFVVTILVVLVILITSMELVVYSGDSYFQRKYEKYQVLDDVSMEMEDLLEVSREMMDYLRGDREDLTVFTLVGGEERDFFNQREKDHMADVRALFIGGIIIRRIALLSILAILILLSLMNKKKGVIIRTLSKTYVIGIILFTIGLVSIGIAMFLNFTRVFTIFHEIFFTNDLWLLDPRTDLLINVLPEGFFVDTAKEIGIVFGSLLLVTTAAAVVTMIYQKRKSKNI